MRFMTFFIVLILIQITFCIKKVSSNLQSEPHHLQNQTISSTGTKIVAGMAATGATAVATSAVVTGAGFTSAGIVAGSAAAGVQAGIGNVVAGSAFATAQSLGALGAVTALGAVGAVVLVAGIGFLGYTWYTSTFG